MLVFSGNYEDLRVIANNFYYSHLPPILPFWGAPFEKGRKKSTIGTARHCAFMNTPNITVLYVPVPVPVHMAVSRLLNYAEFAQMGQPHDLCDAMGADIILARHATWNDQQEQNRILILVSRCRWGQGYV